MRVEVFFRDETLWLTQKRMAELFGVEVHTVNYHLKEIFKSGELAEESVIRRIRIPAPDGKSYLTVQRLDAFLQFNDYKILRDAGRISTEIAKALAGAEFEKFRVLQDRDYESDFDREVKRLRRKNERPEDGNDHSAS